MPYDDPDDTTWTKVIALAEDCQGESNAFTVVAPFPEPDPSRPLYVLIHPGDTVQTRSDVFGSENPRAILAYSRDRQADMGEEVDRLIETGWDVAVLHRFSSSYGFGTSNTVEEFERAIDDIHDVGAVLFGDDLAGAAAWLVAEGAAAERPAVLLSGSWSDAEHGCVAMVGTELERAGVTTHLAHSACVSPDGSGTEWTPKAGRLALAEAVALAPPAPPVP